MKIYAQISDNRSVALWNLKNKTNTKAKNRGSRGRGHEFVNHNGVRILLSKNNEALNGLK